MGLRGTLRCLVVLLAASCTASAWADVAVESTPAGREAKVVTLYFAAEAIVHGTVVSRDAQQRHYAFKVGTAVKPATGLPATLTIEEARLPVLNKVGQQTGETVVTLTPGKQYLLFLVPGEAGVWKLPSDSLWDGFHVGNPADYGFLPCGGVETPDLKKSPTYQTVVTLTQITAANPADRVPGLRILFRASARSGGHRSGWDACQAAYAKLDQPLQQRLISAVIAEPGILENFLAWDLVQMAVTAKATDVAPWAAQQMNDNDPSHARSVEVAAVLAVRLGSGQTQSKACARLADLYLNHRPNRLDQVALALGQAADPDVEKQIRRHLGQGANDQLLHKALLYYKHSRTLGPGDVKTLIPLVKASSVGMEAADVLAPIVGKSFRIEGGGRAPLNESKQWQAWWQNEGSRDPRYQ